jgi:hypothetical protein
MQCGVYFLSVSCIFVAHVELRAFDHSSQARRLRSTSARTSVQSRPSQIAQLNRPEFVTRPCWTGRIRASNPLQAAGIGKHARATIAALNACIGNWGFRCTTRMASLDC